MERGNRKVRIGKVVSDKMDKTIVVATEKLVAHPLYKKQIKMTKKYKAHDEENQCKVGDTVKNNGNQTIIKRKMLESS